MKSKKKRKATDFITNIVFVLLIDMTKSTLISYCEVLKKEQEQKRNLEYPFLKKEVNRY